MSPSAPPLGALAVSAALLSAACGGAKTVDGGGCDVACTVDPEDETGEASTSTTGDAEPPTPNPDLPPSEPELCEVQPMATPEPPNLMLVLDRSGSMMTMIDGESTWSILHETVMAVADAWEDEIKFGAKVFPSAWPDDASEGCAVDSAVDAPTAVQNRSQISASIPPADAEIPPFSFTPAETAYRNASTWLNSERIHETRALVLFLEGPISDGLDGRHECPGNAVDGLIEAIATNAANQVWTYVVGFGLTDPVVVAHMNAYAEAGGVAQPGELKFLSALDAEGLIEAFEDVARGVRSCQFVLDHAPTHPDLTRVFANGEEVPLRIGHQACLRHPGWQWADSTTGPAIRLCGDTCEAFLAEPESVEVAVQAWCL